MSVEPKKSLLADESGSSYQQVKSNRNYPTCVTVATAAITAATGTLALVTMLGDCRDISYEECEEKHGELRPAVALGLFSATAGTVAKVFKSCFPRNS